MLLWSYAQQFVVCVRLHTECTWFAFGELLWMCVCECWAYTHTCGCASMYWFSRISFAAKKITSKRHNFVWFYGRERSTASTHLLAKLCRLPTDFRGHWWNYEIENWFKRNSEAHELYSWKQTMGHHYHYTHTPNAVWLMSVHSTHFTEEK